LKEQAANHGLPSAVVTFREHTRTVLQTNYKPRLLTTYTEKLEQLAATGIDYCIVLDFTPELASLSAGDFMEKILIEKFKVNFLLIGYDHRFGNNRSEGFLQYAEYGKNLGIQVRQFTSLQIDTMQVSSSAIRRLLENGKVEEVAGLLSYPYRMSGYVIAGNRIGRTIGFPTANVRIEEQGKVVPAVGVYGVEIIHQGETYTGMLHIGNRPTVNMGDDLSVEVHILNFNKDIYGDQLTLIFKHYIRENVKFDSLEQLQNQLNEDKEKIIRLMQK
ncbi:MAG: riboflavin biosynthesis protein RibF, partial [Tannerellaceae bacterium]|nr:riboflavin biosynthesis protein RibF [Tannerellaceae bacterium]